jgi:hypothetical protein
MSAAEYLRLGVGYVFVIFGQTLLLIGLEASILPIGKLVGGSLVKLKKGVFIILFGFLFGLLATVAEPALAVLGVQIALINERISSTVFVWLLGVGVGAAVGFAMFRVMKNINIKLIFALFYGIIFITVFFIPNQFVAIAFDGSGATTGDVSVPFILALGLGVSATMSKTKTNEDSFGIIGIASIGPIIVVFLYGLFIGNSKTRAHTAGTGHTLGDILVGNLGSIALAIVPIIVVFVVFQLIFIKLPKKQLIRILAASVVVYIGLYIFLTGVDFGFSIAGQHIGKAFLQEGKDWLRWLLLPVGLVLGGAITLSEPSVTVLSEQVEKITNGYIKKNTIRFTLAIGIGVAALISLLKVLANVNILWFLIPLYISALVMTIFTPKLFVGLAFDSGGVASGAITSAFLTPLAIGVSQSLGQDVLISGFGTIGFISVMPLIAVQALGIVYSLKLKKSKAAAIAEELRLAQETEYAKTAERDTAEERPPEGTLANELDKLENLL